MNPNMAPSSLSMKFEVCSVDFKRDRRAHILKAYEERGHPGSSRGRRDGVRARF